MKEDFLQFIFKNRLWIDNSLVLSNGKAFEIIDTGILNQDAGPDFFNAKIKIDETVWVGNVEIHINSSDWFKHNHHKDFSYNNVILHVVFNNDKPVKRKNGDIIPVWEIKFPQHIFNKFSDFKNNQNTIACEDYIDITEPINLKAWVERMGVEQLESKTDLIKNYLNNSNSDWEQAFYILLSRNFGFHINSLAFEQLALNTPISIIRKNNDNLFAIEALLFGQAGFLKNISDAYSQKLWNEYKFLSNKYSLKPIDYKIWKFGKIRPGNMPAVRIAQLSSLLKSFQGLFSSIINKKDISEIYEYFKIQTSDYWKNHYNFGKPVNIINSSFGKSAFNIIMINTIAPFRLLYSRSYFNHCEDIPVKWLDNIKAENNRITRVWKNIGVKVETAFESQALIHLKKNYCDNKKCLYCNIGTDIFKKFGKL